MGGGTVRHRCFFFRTMRLYKHRIVKAPSPFPMVICFYVFIPATFVSLSTVFRYLFSDKEKDRKARL